MKRCRTGFPVHLVLAAALAAGGMLTTPPARAAGSGERVASDSLAAWHVMSSPFADLWYHGLAVVGFHGFGPNPLYDVAYGRRAARARAGGPLSEEAPHLLSDLQGDPAFEVLHFVPVYFPDTGPGEALAWLREVAGAPVGTVRPRGAPSDMGAELVSDVLPLPAQRRTLGRFVDVLEREWADGLGEELVRQEEVRKGLLLHLESRWSGRFVPALAPYLTRHGLLAGRLFVTPALGLEGRFFLGDPRDPEDNVVIVGLDPGEEDLDRALAPVVRELCFPAVRDAFQDMQSRYADRVAASRASDAAATRCGELLLGTLLPAALPAYRSHFGLRGPDAAWSSLPDPGERRDWDRALMRALNLQGGS